MNIYIGNLSPEVTETDLKNLFSEYGDITSLKLIKDAYSGASKGFGFIEMTGDSNGLKAISKLNLKELKGKKITVSEAKAKSDNMRSAAGKSESKPFNNRSRW